MMESETSAKVQLGLRSPYDRPILRLAIPALGSLAAEPLYVLVDTAIVGHLGRSQLAALGISATILTSAFALFNFLAYGTTAQVARASGAGRRDTADELGVQALWLSGLIGIAFSILIAASAVPLVDAFGGKGQTADYAVTYLRIAAIGYPAAFVALGAQGYLRGVADLRSPLIIVVAGNIANVVLELVFVYALGWGIKGSAAGTAIAQAGMGTAFLVKVVATAHRTDRPRVATMRVLLSFGRFIFVRTLTLMGSLVLAGAVIARFGDASLGAHQVAFQLWLFLSLVLDAIAIAGQVLVGQSLGAGRGEEAFAESVRMIWLSVVAGALFAGVMLATSSVVPKAFTSDHEVLAKTAVIWPVFALMQPVNGAVFALDGILIGAGDVRYLMWSMVAAFGVCAGLSLTALALDTGILGVWLALVALILVRLGTLGVRFLRRQWLVTGWAAG
jgi:putative MATE family efflux protein